MIRLIRLIRLSAGLFGLYACSRTVTRSYSPGLMLASARLTLRPVPVLTADSTRVVVTAPAGPIPNAEVLVRQADKRLAPIPVGSATAVRGDSLQLRVRALGYGLFDTTLVADHVRGHEVEVFLAGVIATPPVVLVERVPWWKFWAR